MAMHERCFSSGEYRYGFNGKENDKAISGGDLDFGARIYDSRVGRWLSVDVKASKYPSLSPFNYCANNPTIFSDIDGNDFVIVTTNLKNETWNSFCSVINNRFEGLVSVSKSDISKSDIESYNSGKLPKFNNYGNVLKNSW